MSRRSRYNLMTLSLSSPLRFDKNTENISMPPQKDKVDYNKVIVKKPWGFEYLMFENGEVGLWYLHIKKGARTSMHCHPQKKTGLVLLSGKAILSFLSNSTNLKPISKVMIREGLFHSTAAVSHCGITLIEVENPCDKGNLVRMEDEYGRQEKPYEGKDSLLPSAGEIRLKTPKNGRPRNYQLDGCSLTLERVKTVAGLRGRPKDEVIVVLSGGLESRDGERVLGPGDVVSADILGRLAEKFLSPAGSEILALRKLPRA